MAFVLKPSQFFRPLYITSRLYCEEKSIYQKHEEGKQPRTAYGKPYPEWRSEWIERPGEWKSKLNIFVEKHPTAEILNAMSKLPFLTLQQIKDWWANMKVVQEKNNQKYLVERSSVLGSNLGAVHFFTYRHCAVRLKGEMEWLAGHESTLDLPNKYQAGYFVEAVDCEKFHHNGIRYEGLENLSNLNFLKWLSLRNNKHVDMWCIDRVAGQNGNTLEYLDISGTKLSVGCIVAISRMTALKVLVVSDPGENIELQAALSMLETENPNLIIKLDNPEVPL